MANAKIGSQASWSGDLVESITADKQLVPGDSGKLFFCEQSGTAAVVNLPQISASIAGWHATFILKTASAANITIMAYGLPETGGSTGDSDIVVFREYLTADAASTEANTADGVRFVGGQSKIGLKVDIYTDGTKWYVYAFGTADANIITPDAS